MKTIPDYNDYVKELKFKENQCEKLTEHFVDLILEYLKHEKKEKPKDKIQFVMSAGKLDCIDNKLRQMVLGNITAKFVESGWNPSLSFYGDEGDGALLEFRQKI